MLIDYKKLKDAVNNNAPADFQLPEDTAGSKELFVNDSSTSIRVFLDGENVNKIILTVWAEEMASEDHSSSTYYKVFVGGLEGDLGWSSMNYYNAMQSTLKDHKEHTGTNDQGISAKHSYDNGVLTVEITK